MNWIKTKFLLCADEIHNSEIEYPVAEPNSNFSVHIAPTELNTHLPDDYFETTAAGKPEWWINRYLKGSFENKEGLVYPNHFENVVEPFEIPDHWHRYIGGDFGLHNPTAFSFLAVDPATGTVYIYDEYKKAQLPVNEHSDYLTSKIDEFKYNVLQDMIGDAEAQKTTAQSQTSLFEHYAEYGVYWSPSTKKVQDSILKKFTFFENGKLKIFSSCKETLQEFQEYKYPDRTLDKDTKNEDYYEKPIKKNDHLMDAIRYVIAELPDNPLELINLSYNARYTINRARIEDKQVPHALREEPSQSYSSTDWLGY